jgi:putative membrane protein insertion efficiency factor
MLDKIAIKLITIYQHTLSLLIGNQCRFYPSCSHYTQEAIQKHGLVRGIGLGTRRILRCHPWHPGGIDLVPDANSSIEPSKSPTL